MVVVELNCLVQEGYKHVHVYIDFLLQSTCFINKCIVYRSHFCTHARILCAWICIEWWGWGGIGLKRIMSGCKITSRSVGWGLVCFGGYQHFSESHIMTQAHYLLTSADT